MNLTGVLRLYLGEFFFLLLCPSDTSQNERILLLQAIHLNHTPYDKPNEMLLQRYNNILLRQNTDVDRSTRRFFNEYSGTQTSPAV